MLLRRRVKGQWIKGAPWRVSKVLSLYNILSNFCCCSRFSSVNAVWTQSQTTGREDWLQINPTDTSNSHDRPCCVMPGCFCTVTATWLDDSAALAKWLVIVQIPQYLLDIRPQQLWSPRKTGPWPSTFLDLQFRLLTKHTKLGHQFFSRCFSAREVVEKVSLALPPAH